MVGDLGRGGNLFAMGRMRGRTGRINSPAARTGILAFSGDSNCVLFQPYECDQF
jgi:hypothetical protein